MKLDLRAKYQETHEWARQDGDLIVCGVTDYAQDSLSDVVYVELPELGATLAKGDPLGVIESVKAASDLYIPMSGEIIQINDALEEAPELVNDDPYGKGWMIKLKPSDPDQWGELLVAADYQKMVETEK